MKDSTAGLIVVVVLGVLWLAGNFVYKQIMVVADTGSAISGDVITRYIELIKADQYDDAYETCLSNAYKNDISRTEFIATHTSRKVEFGQLEGWKETTYDQLADISDSETLIGIKGVLYYANRDVFVLYRVNPAIQPYRIQKIYGGSNRSTDLSYGVW